MQKSQDNLSGKSVYGVLKHEIYRETINYLSDTTEESIRLSGQQLQWQRERKDREVAVKGWEQQTKAKL